MVAFHVFNIVQMLPNRLTHHILWFWLKPAIKGQINLSKVVETNTFDNLYRKIETFLIDQIF